MTWIHTHAFMIDKAMIEANEQLRTLGLPEKPEATHRMAMSFRLQDVSAFHEDVVEWEGIEVKCTRVMLMCGQDYSIEMKYTFLLKLI